MSHFLKCFLFLLLFWSGEAWGVGSPFAIEYPEAISLDANGEAVVPFRIQIPKEYFVYRDKTELQFLKLEGFVVKKIDYPTPRIRKDPFFKKEIQVFEGTSTIFATFQSLLENTVGPKQVEGLLKFQGCSNVLCYPLETHFVSLSVVVENGGDSRRGTNSSSRTEPVSFTSFKNLIHAQDFQLVWEHGFWIVFLVVFLGGFLTSLTPCILPVIPLTLMVIGVRSDQHFRHNLFLSFSLVLGLALTYAGLGVAAVAFGKSLGFVFQSQWFVLFLSFLFFLLALSMLGLFEVHLPLFLRNRLNQIRGHGVLGAFASGLVVGLLAAPCAGPVVGGLLLFVATTQNFFLGFWLLFIYAFGMGLLFLVLGTGFGTLEGRFRRGTFTKWVKRFLGLLLLLTSLFYLNTVVPLEKYLDRIFSLKQESIVWLSSEKEGLERAARERKILLLDFYADWCAPCKELERGFFRKSEVISMLKQMIPVRVDATFADNREIQDVLKKYQVVGWPTVVFVAPDGKILENLRVVSYNPTLLFENMKRALEN